MLLLVAVYLFGSVILGILDFYFISLSYIIVYVGAIAILFLFIIMMIAPKSTPLPGFHSLALFSFSLSSLYLLYDSLSPNYITTIHFNNWFTFFWTFYDIHSIGIFMINGWPLAITMIGILLTSVLIGILDEAQIYA